MTSGTGPVGFGSPSTAGWAAAVAALRQLRRAATADDTADEEATTDELRRVFTDRESAKPPR